MKTLRTLTLLLAGMSMLFSGSAQAFGEEFGSAIDTAAKTSTHHLYLTRALAVCAGFSGNGKEDPFDAPADAERIAIADQLTDSEHLRHGDVVHSHCSAKPYVMPTPAALGCPSASGTRSLMPVTGEGNITGLLPIPKWNPAQGCFTSRFGPYSNDFHFPDAARVAVLRDWAFAASAQLTGTARFSFGAYFDTPWNADCNATRAEIIDTGSVAPGSLAALGIYLHAIGDFHSHAECLAHWDGRRNPPWPSHTVSTRQTGCAFIDHARELGCPAESAHDSVLAPAPAAGYVQHAEAAALTVYDELRRFREKRQPADDAATLTTRLGNTPVHRAWLAHQVHRFVTGWSWAAGAEERRAFANALARQCAALTPEQLPADLPPQPGETDCRQ